jgi:autotransporter-associated beta strand protein
MPMIAVPTTTGVPRPRIYSWVGASSNTLYWDDPKNWAEGEYPNHPEATAMFSHALSQDTTILLRKDIILANIWFSEKKYSYSILPEGDPNMARLIFMTGQQLANITLDEENFATHTINTHIIHSCKKMWGVGWQVVSPSPPPVPVPKNQSKLRLGGVIANYKAAPRASLNLDGYIDVELSGVNTFIGPVVVNRGALLIKNSESIPTGTNLLLYDPGQIVIDEGIVVKAKRFQLNGENMPRGVYVANDFPEDKLASVSARGPLTIRLTTSALMGGGSIVVSG